ncbi:MAG: hypothetical protein A3G75_04610 [Verrucomicrobia bacterium RIFCSPLOWO2_12_FULL_64_8]|nr:MAG: hypothetical protein A3G75_04610 [Verrucomicrobia bacterium RIFCSPLOWO2_12_FULL_64_8]
MTRGRLLCWFGLVLAPALGGCAAEVPRIAPADAARRVAEGGAVLVDVREPAEWAETGVAAPAALLALSDFEGARKEWAPFLEHNRDKVIVLYCRSGRRSGIAASALAKQGFHVANAGGLKDWVAAGLPVRRIGDATGPK